MKKVQGKKKRHAAIAAAEAQATTDAEKKPVAPVKIDETKSRNAEVETAAESVVPEGTIVEEVAGEAPVQVVADAVEETAVTEPEVEDVTVDLLNTKDEDVIF